MNLHNHSLKVQISRKWSSWAPKSVWNQTGVAYELKRLKYKLRSDRLLHICPPHPDIQPGPLPFALLPLQEVRAVQQPRWGLGEQHRDVAASAGCKRMETGSERKEDNLKYSQGQSALPWKRWCPNSLSVSSFYVELAQRTRLNFLFPHMWSPAVLSHAQSSTIISLVHLSLCVLISARCC